MLVEFIGTYLIMLLVADIGNTSTTMGVYKGDQLLKTWKLTSDKNRSHDEYGIIINNMIKHEGLIDKLEGAMISSVVLPLTEKFKTAIENYLDIPVTNLSTKINTGLKFDVDNPKEVGADRIANGYAAFRKYKSPTVVVDFGTATTFDIVNADGKFIGGIITPGIGISAEALSSFTSLLPKVKLEAPGATIGRNTIDAMLSGLVRGHAAMIDGLIVSVEEELGSTVTTIATGGYSPMITECMKRPFDYLDPNLTLEGLRLIYELNHAQ